MKKILIGIAIILFAASQIYGGDTETDTVSGTVVVTENLQDSVKVGNVDADTSRSFKIGGANYVGFFARLDNQDDDNDIIIWLDVAPIDQDERSIFGSMYVQVDSLIHFQETSVNDFTIYKSVSATFPIWARYARLRAVAVMAAEDTVLVTTKITKTFLGRGL